MPVHVNSSEMNDLETPNGETYHERSLNFWHMISIVFAVLGIAALKFYKQRGSNKQDLKTFDKEKMDVEEPMISEENQTRIEIESEERNHPSNSEE